MVSARVSYLYLTIVMCSLAQARLEILLVKEAEKRSDDGIHPRIDRQLLSNNQTFSCYETLRRILVEYILTVCQPPPIPLHTLTNFIGPSTAFSSPWKGRSPRSAIDVTGYEVCCSLPDDTVLVPV